MIENPVFPKVYKVSSQSKVLVNDVPGRLESVGPLLQMKNIPLKVAVPSWIDPYKLR